MSNPGEKWKEYYKTKNLSWFNSRINRDASYYQKMFERSELVIALLQDLELGRSLDILEAGCGTGELSICLSFKYNNISTFDYNKEAIDIVNKLMVKVGQKLNPYVDDLLNIKYKSKKYDLIFNQAVFEYLKPSERKLALYEIKTILKPGGRLSIIVQNTTHPVLKLFLLQPDVYRLSPQILIDEFKASGFKQIECRGLFTAKVITNIILPKEVNMQIRYYLYRILFKIPLPKYLHQSLGSQFLVTGVS